mgnify:FL=1
MCATADIPLELEQSANGKSQKRLAGCWLVMLEGQITLDLQRQYMLDKHRGYVKNKLLQLSWFCLLRQTGKVSS